MLKELSNLRQYDMGVKRAKDDLAAATWSYDQQIKLIQRILAQVEEKRKADPTVRQAVGDLGEMRAAYDNAEGLAKQAVIDYWEEFGFSTGKKSVVMEGCKLGVRETTNRQIVNPDLMVLAAREDEVYAKVIRELRPIVNRASFNAWVDLKSPPGVDVTKSITATVTVLEK